GYGLRLCPDNDGSFRAALNVLDHSASAKQNRSSAVTLGLERSFAALCLNDRVADKVSFRRGCTKVCCAVTRLTLTRVTALTATS
ncbi:MAG: hypothetical protein ABJ263_19715, partial [Tateyamaria sp.]|uniref:hypothetical protein n=1 Tax=Tateyamaria sp. TaxID=1929288 RepID=UPI003274A8F2